MDLSSMLRREDFFPAFFATIRNYYKKVYDIDVEIDFSSKKDCNLVIKPFLSAATAPKLSSAARSFFYTEWNVRNSMLKHIAAKCGVAFFTHSGKAFSKFAFCVKPKTVISKDLVIAPNNRSIRFFDYSTGTVGCMVKDGFTGKYFQNQLRFRLTHSYPFLLPMERWGDDWFIEPIMHGHPLARVTDESAYQKSLDDAFSAIRQLAKDTVCFADAAAYTNGLIDRILLLCEKAGQEKHIQTVLLTEQLIGKLRALVCNSVQVLPLCMSHGDFQTGNIWLDESGKTLIYDWETTDERSVWFDSAVLYYSLRREGGWKNFLSAAKAEGAFCTSTEKMKSDICFVKCVVMLEDILFHLEDMMELPQDWGGDIYDRYIDNLDKAVSEVGMV